jgi:hypothetical protein
LVIRIEPSMTRIPGGVDPELGVRLGQPVGVDADLEDLRERVGGELAGIVAAGVPAG